MTMAGGTTKGCKRTGERPGLPARMPVKNLPIDRHAECGVEYRTGQDRIIRRFVEAVS